MVAEAVVQELREHLLDVKQVVLEEMVYLLQLMEPQLQELVAVVELLPLVLDQHSKVLEDQVVEDLLLGILMEDLERLIQGVEEPLHLTTQLDIQVDLVDLV